jgi:hypothetical protein
MVIHAGKKRDLGKCPKCGERLTNIYGVIRCSDGTCDYNDRNLVEAAEEQIVQGERSRLFDRLPKLTVPHRRRGEDGPKYIDEPISNGGDS